jgi:hypothetical protein
MGVSTIIGLIITAAWCSLAGLYTQGTVFGASRIEPNQLADLLANNTGELAVFWIVVGYVWLVVGYFEHRQQHRQYSASISSATEQAAAAMHKVDSETKKFEDYQQSRMRAAQPSWQVLGCIAHKEQHEINIRNVGAPASTLRAIWDRDLPIIVLLSNMLIVERGQQLIIKVAFRGARLDNFDLVLEYQDALGGPHRASISVSGITVKMSTTNPADIDSVRSSAGEPATQNGDTEIDAGADVSSLNRHRNTSKAAGVPLR